MQKNTRETDLLKKEPWLVPRYGLADLKEFLRCNRIQHILKPLKTAVEEGILPESYLNRHVMLIWGCEDEKEFPVSSPKPYTVFTDIPVKELSERFYKWYLSDEWQKWVGERCEKAAEDHKNYI